MRQCIACRERKVKQELFRVVRTPEGNIVADMGTKGKLPGRGAYLCKDIACFENARKRKVLEKAFQTKIEDVIYESIKEGIVKESDG
jgi:predicted RNA-binding protein YlxR (DUF448 family)